ncbi:MAG TPA: ATP-binding cassette domain-containing protein, partial [Aestuariivirga sp.]
MNEAQGTQSSSIPSKMEARDLSFFYGASKALKNVSLPLYQNKVTSIIGPSGCGKSTLLRIFNRIYELYPNQRAEGELTLSGGNVLASAVDLNMLRA